MILRLTSRQGSERFVYVNTDDISYFHSVSGDRDNTRDWTKIHMRSLDGEGQPWHLEIADSAAEIYRMAGRP